MPDTEVFIRLKGRPCNETILISLQGLQIFKGACSSLDPIMFILLITVYKLFGCSYYGDNVHRASKYQETDWNWELNEGSESEQSGFRAICFIPGK